MSKRNPLRNSTRKNTNYKLYKAKKQWVTACATFLLTFGATAVFNSANAQTVNNNKRSNNEIEEVTSATGNSSTNGTVELSATSAVDQSDAASATSQADANSSNSSADTENNVASTTDETSSADDAHHTDTAVASPADSGTQSDENATDYVNAVAASTASDATDASSSSTEEPNNGDTTTTLKTNANGAVDVNPDALKESKINTTDTTVNWSNHRYIMDWDGQAHPASYWDERVTKEVLPWILKENNNEGATFKNITWTSFMNSDGNGNYIPVMNEGPANNRFGYAHGNLVVTNPNGTSTTTYMVIIILACLTMLRFITLLILTILDHKLFILNKIMHKLTFTVLTKLILLLMLQLLGQMVMLQISMAKKLRTELKVAVTNKWLNLLPITVM